MSDIAFIIDLSFINVFYIKMIYILLCNIFLYPNKKFTATHAYTVITSQRITLHKYSP
jgi:hypothetical protein